MVKSPWPAKWTDTNQSVSNEPHYGWSKQQKQATIMQLIQVDLPSSTIFKHQNQPISLVNIKSWLFEGIITLSLWLMLLVITCNFMIVIITGYLINQFKLVIWPI